MANRIVLILVFISAMCGFSGAQITVNVPGGSSTSTIQNAINTAAGSGSGGIVSFTGTSNISWNSQITLTCPANFLTLTGPTTTYDQPGIVNSWAARPTATLRNSNTGSSGQLFVVPAGCQKPITIQYLEVDGNRPSTGGGTIYINGGTSGGYSNATGPVTLAYDFFHGNQEFVPTVCGLNCVTSWDDEDATLIDIEGGQGGNTIGPVVIANIHDNILGATVAGNPQAGDCGNLMGVIGFCTDRTTGDGCNFVGNNSVGGYCSGIGVHTSVYNSLIENNVYAGQEQDEKWFESSSYPNFNFETNVLSKNNDYSGYIRVMVEDQAGAVTYAGSGSTSGTNCPSQTDGACQIRQYNSVHDQVLPANGNWGYSEPHTAFEDDNDNLMISNTNSSGNAGPGNFEWWASGNSHNDNNLEQGYIGCGTDFGFGVSSSTSISNNQFEFYTANSGNCSATNSSSQTIVGAQNEYPCCIVSSSFPMFVGNTYTGSASVHTSVAPSFSPNGGSFSTSVAVTLTDNGNTSGAGPRGNTNLWCTTDGSTPAPKQGTSVFYPSGYVLTLTSTTNLKCVGMWGGQNQPAPASGSSSAVKYPSGFGYNSSSVVSATFTGGGTPSAASPTFTPPAGNITGSTSVTLASSTPSSTIKYCLTSGCTPTTTYAGPLTVSSTTTITAFATASGFVQSPNSSATYTLVAPPAAATPTFSPGAPLTFTNPINVSIASSTPNATIYYTVNGTTPTTSSTVYTAPISVTATQTINAIAAASGFTNSLVGSAIYTFSLFLGNNQIDNTTSNTYPGAANSIYAVTGSSSAGYTVTGCVVNQGSATVTNGAHTQCFLTLATSPTTQQANALCSGTYTNPGATGTSPGAIAQIPLSGCPTLTPNQGYFVASITDDPLQPSGLGFNDCGSAANGCTGAAPTVGVGTYASFYYAATYGQTTGLPTTLNKGIDQVTQYATLTAVTSSTATPVISPTAGPITGTTAVTITDTTPSSTIYYTTDGSTPTTGSTVYTGSFNISATTTVKALGVASGLVNSAIATNIYTLSTGTISSVMFAPLSKINFVTPGSTDQMTINILYTDGQAYPLNVSGGGGDPRGSKITSYTSSNPSVATIDAFGVVTGVSSTLQPNWTLLTAVVTDRGGNTYTANWLEGVGNSLTAGYK